MLLIFCILKKKKIYPSYISKHNSNRGKQVIILTIPKGEACKAKSKGRGRWHYLEVKELSALIRGITSKHQGDFYCLNFLHSFATEKKLESHKTSM